MAIRGAGHHMSMIADPLAEATAVQVPGQVPGHGDLDAADSMPARLIGHGTRTRGPERLDGARRWRRWAPMQAAEIKQFAFQPKTLEVPVGTTVTWTNQDAIQHSVTATDGSFDSGLFTQGGTFAQTFEQPGTYAYFCARHGSMQGEVKVIG